MDIIITVKTVPGLKKESIGRKTLVLLRVEVEGAIRRSGSLSIVMVSLVKTILQCMKGKKGAVPSVGTPEKFLM
jgi:hypothetical protein